MTRDLKDNAVATTGLGKHLPKCCCQRPASSILAEQDVHPFRCNASVFQSSGDEDDVVLRTDENMLRFSPMSYVPTKNRVRPWHMTRLADDGGCISRVVDQRSDQPPRAFLQYRMVEMDRAVIVCRIRNSTLLGKTRRNCQAQHECSASYAPQQLHGTTLPCPKRSCRPLPTQQSAQHSRAVLFGHL